MSISNCQFESRISLARQLAIGNWKLAIVGLVILAALMAAAGCTGHGLIYSVPLGTKRMSAVGPLLTRQTPQECYYWVNEKDELCITLREFRGSLLGKSFEQETVLSLVVPGVPAGTGRDYRMDRRTARMRLRAGFTHLRAGSQNGILSVWDYGRGVLRGRFRFYVRQQSYSVLTGWSGDASVLVVGEFAGVPDRVRGEKLLARTEEGALNRQESPSPANKSAAMSGP